MQRDGEIRLGGPLAVRHRLNAVGDGPVVVFSHGLGTDQTAWHSVVRGLPRSMTAVLFDLPGAGPLLPDEFDPDHYRSLSRFADDLLDLLDKLGVERCTYVGHSVSGMIGLLASIEAPERFEHLVLLNASPRYLNDGAYVGGFDRADLETLLGGMAANYQAWVAGFAPIAIAADVPGAVEEFSSGLLAMRPDVTVRVARTIFESDVRHLLKSVTVPTTLVHSRGDVAVPESVAAFLHENIPHSELVWIDATGHLPHLSAPEQVVDALRDRLG